MNRSLFEQLESHSLAGAKADLARARTRQPALQAYPTPESAVRALRSRAPAKGCRRDELVAALMVECQGGARSLQEVLLQGFLPRLVRIRGEVEAMIGELDTLDQLLAVAFAESVAAFPGLKEQPRPTAFLINTTICRFVSSVQELYEAEALLVPVGLRVRLGDEPSPWSDTSLATGAPIEAANDLGGFTDETSALLERLVGDRVPPERLAVVKATVIHDETLLEYVDRRYPGLDRRSRRRQLRSLHCERAKIVGYLRRALPALGVSPQGSAS
jgi:hypothetical protein